MHDQSIESQMSLVSKSHVPGKRGTPAWCAGADPAAGKGGAQIVDQ